MPYINRLICYFERFLAADGNSRDDNINACLSLAYCYKKAGLDSMVLPSLLRSFLYDEPRQDVCEEISRYYRSAGKFLLAKEWKEICKKY